MIYIGKCVEWPTDDVYSDGGLCDMIDQALEISRRTFLKHVGKDNVRELEEQLGYESRPQEGLTMAGDYHVGYFASKLHGRKAYFVTHSAIEYVFSEVA